MPDLKITTEQTPSATVVKLIGEMGIASSAIVDQVFLRLSANHNCDYVIDLSGVTFISSIAMGQLLAFQRGVSRGPCHVRYAAPQPLVLQAIKRAKLNEIYEIHDTLEAALAKSAS